MCGICGFLGKSNKPILEDMASAIGHRGPDDSGIFVAGDVGLAHRRLSVIDLIGGHQPMRAATGEVLIFNGEIYNFREIRKELEGLGHFFQSDSDSEVLLASYCQWGRECLQKLRGMFAFAIWDPRQKELFLARDRVGIKPLYYANYNGTFYFASEAKALLEIPGFPRRLNRERLPHYLTFRYTPGEQTLFAGINKLLPGHCLIIPLGGQPQKSKYWSLEFEPNESLTEKQWQERFWETFEESVRLRMISDVPLGAYLSGGLDSSLIVAAMDDLSDHPVDAFSVGFKDQRFNELPYAEHVAKQFGCNHHLLHAEEEAAQVLSRVIYHLDEPLGDLAAIPTFLMARETKPAVTVVLSGEGADELLAGYPKYSAVLAGQQLSRFLPKGVLSLGPRLTTNLSLRRAFGAMMQKERARSYLELTAVFSIDEQMALLNSARNKVDVGEGPYSVVSPYFNREADSLSQLLSLDFHTWLPDDLLLKNDRMTMAHAVEARVPYLDHKLIELCARIPSRFKLRWNREKILLRGVMEGRLPKNICKRKKTGFTVPLGYWYKTSFGRKMDEVLSRGFIERQGLFNWDYVNGLMCRSMDNTYYRRQLWSLVALGLWQKRFRIESF